jgi:hypothetical protein
MLPRELLMRTTRSDHPIGLNTRTATQYGVGALALAATAVLVALPVGSSATMTLGHACVTTAHASRNWGLLGATRTLAA